MRNPVAILLSCCLVGPAMAASGPITVSAAWSRATYGAGATAIGFMTIDNAGAADVLTGANCTGAAAVSLHVEKDGTMAMPGMAPMRTDSMERLDSVPIPKRGHVQFKPGGMHIMLENMASALTPGQTVACVLSFRNAGAVAITLKVGPAGARAAPQ